MAATVTIPLTTLTLGQHDFGPAAISDALVSTSFATLGFVVSSLAVRCLPIAAPRAGRNDLVSPWV